MMQNGRINSPKLRPRLSSSEKPKSIIMTTCFERERGVDKTKYGHESIMINTIATIYHHKTSHKQVMIHYNIEV